MLTAIADLTHSRGGILFGQALTTQKIYFDFNGRLDEECNRAYQERHMQTEYMDDFEPRTDLNQPVGGLPV